MQSPAHESASEHAHDLVAAQSSDVSALVSTSEQPPPGVRVMQVRGRPVVVVGPSAPGRWSYLGHVAIELLGALAYGRLLGAPVAVVPPKHLVGRALLEIDSDEVRIVGPGLEHALIRTFYGPRGARGRVEAARAHAQKKAEQDIAVYVQEHPDLPRAARKHLKILRNDLSVARSRRERPEGPYWRRRLIASPVRTSLTAEAERRATELARGEGIQLDRPIVTVHVRERGYKFGRETQDGVPRKGTLRYGGRDDSTRNAWIETHFDAMDLLVEKGYTVVRIGDPTMTPVKRPGVVDLATSASRDPLVELYCLFRSRFLLCGESGPFSVSYLTNTPLLAVNGTDAIGAYPVRRDGILLMKSVIDREDGRMLSLGDFSSAEYLTFLRCPGRYQYVQNTPEEVVGAVEEMLDLLDEETQETAAQSSYREVLTRAAESAVDLQFVAKWGADRGFLGHGRVARSQTEPWFAGAAESMALLDA